MRRLRASACVLTMIALAACGRTTATPLPVSSVDTITLGATVVPTATPAPATGPQRGDLPPAPTVASVATPTPLTARVATAGTSRGAPAGTASAAAPTAVAPRTPPAGATAPPTKTDRLADLPSGAPQQTIGVAADGLTLLNVRTGKNDGFTRLVFDVSRADGRTSPIPRTRLWTEGNTVVVAVDGVRDDVYAGSLGGGEQRVNLGMVQAIYRIPVRDDTSAVYGVTVSGATRVTLSAATTPTRVIVDIADK